MNPRCAAHILLLGVIMLCSIEVQSQTASPRIGVLNPGTPESAEPMLVALRQALRQHGYMPFLPTP
jgi:hypothetical protein